MNEQFRILSGSSSSAGWKFWMKNVSFPVLPRVARRPRLRPQTFRARKALP
ncbi:MAG: hypothetical protein IPF66_06970 [Holophagales bacterium]|nr:hypothetical protein [Holophagales bacterium]